MLTGPGGPTTMSCKAPVSVLLTPTVLGTLILGQEKAYFPSPSQGQAFEKQAFSRPGKVYVRILRRTDVLEYVK